MGRVAAQAVLGEIGADMSVWPTAGHCASWARIAHGQNESAGKRRSGKTPKGQRWLRGILVECAQAAAKTKGTAMAERYRQLARRIGKRKAIVAVAHNILTTAYHLLETDQLYVERGPDVVRTQAEETLKRHAITQLHKLGYSVNLTALPRPAA